MFYDKNQNFTPLSNSAQNKSSVLDLLKNYLNFNPEIGYLVFQVFQESPLQGRLPVANAKITLSILLGDSYFISKVIMTNSDGKTDPIFLPAVQAKFSITPGNATVCSTYIARVEAPNFLTTDIFNIQVFDGITSIQPVNLLPSKSNNVPQIYQREPI